MQVDAELACPCVSSKGVVQVPFNDILIEIMASNWLAVGICSGTCDQWQSNLRILDTPASRNLGSPCGNESLGAKHLPPSWRNSQLEP